MTNLKEFIQSKKHSYSSILVLLQLASLTAMNAMARPIKIPPPPPPPSSLLLDAFLAVFNAVSSLTLP